MLDPWDVQYVMVMQIRDTELRLPEVFSVSKVDEWLNAQKDLHEHERQGSHYAGNNELLHE
jgi:hypothetical protein